MAGLLRTRRPDVVIWEATAAVAKGDAVRARKRYIMLKNRGPHIGMSSW